MSRADASSRPLLSAAPGADSIKARDFFRDDSRSSSCTRETRMSARFFLMSLTVLVVAVGCAAEARVTRPPEALYLAVEVREHGQTVARPKMLGYEGKNITVERRQPNAADLDFRLVLS